MGDQINRIEGKIDWIMKKLQPEPEKKEEKKTIEQRPTTE